MYTLPWLDMNIIAHWWLGLAGHLREAGVDLVPDKLAEPEDPLIRPAINITSRRTL